LARPAADTSPSSEGNLRKEREAVMPNIKIISRMLWNRVSISDLAEKLDIIVDEVVDMLGAEMTVMERYEVLSAISEIIMERDIS
jgi:hypothetical protein